MNDAAYSLAALARYFLKLGTIGFGGPVALVGYMYRDLVDARRWIGEDDYKEGLALAQLMPGPLAAQLAMYLGYVHYRVLGATVVGAAFVLPSFLMVVAIGWAYQRVGGLPWMQATFYGVGAAVIGIIAISAYKLTTRNIGHDCLLWSIFLAVAAFTVCGRSPKADNVRLDAANGKIYVGYGHALAAIDAKSGKLLERIELAGHPESFQLEPSGTRIFVNVPSAAQIAVVDRSKGGGDRHLERRGEEGEFADGARRSQSSAFRGDTQASLASRIRYASRHADGRSTHRERRRRSFLRRKAQAAVRDLR